MKLGYFTMPLHPHGSDFSKTIVEDLDQMVTLDWLGYREAWIGEHFTFEWENIPNPDLFIAHAAAITKRIRFGTGVSCMPNHNPAMLAHRIAQLDHQTQGRLMWGVGSSSTPGDYELFGFDSETDDRRSFTLASPRTSDPAKAISRSSSSNSSWGSLFKFSHTGDRGPERVDSLKYQPTTDRLFARSLGII